MRARITPRSTTRIPHRAGLPVLLALIALIGVPRTGLGQGYLQGQQLINQSFSGDIMFYVDVVSYKHLEEPEQTYVEIYYALERNQMHFIPLPNDPQVRSSLWEIETVVETEIGDRVTWRRWRRVSQEQSEEDTEQSRTVFDIYPLLLEPGTYRFITTLTDMNSTIEGDTKIGVDRRTVVIPAFPPEELTLSDIEFAVRLGQASSQNEFVKNGLQVVPNPLRTFGLNVPSLSLYSEVYGLSEPAPAGAEPRTYTRSISIEGLNVDYRQVFEDRITKEIRSRNEIVAVSNMYVHMVPTGTYQLILEIVDDTTGERVVRARPFQVVSDVVTVEADELESIEMTDEAIVQLRNEIVYLATGEELDEYDARDAEGKRAFLIEFWGSRDLNPSTPVNEFREEFIARFQYANDNFATPTQPEGWKTDQGRIYITYGNPDDTVNHIMEGATGKPWVEWVYNQIGEQGNAYFIFVDTSGGFGAYALVHSNVRGEIANPQWKEEYGIPPHLF